MSNGADREACQERASAVSARLGQRVRSRSGADLGGGSLKSARSSAPWNVPGTLWERRRDWRRVGTPAQATIVVTCREPKPPARAVTSQQPWSDRRLLIGLHASSLKAKRDTAEGDDVSGPCPGHDRTVHRPSFPLRRAATVPATLPRTWQDRSHMCTFLPRRSQGVPETFRGRAQASPASISPAKS